MALSAARNTSRLGTVPSLKSGYPMLANTTIYQGSLVVLDSAGFLKPGVSATGLVAVGRACKTKTSGSVNGDTIMDVESGAFKWAVNSTALAATDVGSLCYVYDDQTVTLTSTSRSIAGTIHGDGNGNFYVYSALAAPIDGSTISAVASDLSQHAVDLANTSTPGGASLIGVFDTLSLITATTVEDALAEHSKAILGFGVAPQALSGVGAANVTALVTNFTSTGGAQAISLANGTYTGQLKVVHHTVDGGSGVLTPTTAGNFATFTLTNIHDACLLQWSGSAWNIVLNVGGTVG